MENKIQNLNIGDKLTETDLVFYGYMLDIHLLPISIQPSFKSTIGFVGLNVGHTNPMVNLKMSWVEDGFVSFSEEKKKDMTILHNLAIFGWICNSKTASSVTSDRFLLLLDFGVGSRGRRSFKFENMWLQAKGFVDQVKT